MTSSTEGPENGHRFEITVRSQGSYSIVGQPGRFDSKLKPSEPIRVTVRAWDLPAALRKAAKLSLNSWSGWDEKETS